MLQVGDELAAMLGERVETAGPGEAPSADGLLEDLRPNLVLAWMLAFEREHRRPEDLWVAWGAVEHIVALWPLVAERGWPAPAVGGRGLREAVLRTLGAEEAEGLRREVEERTEEVLQDVAPAVLAAALGREAVRAGEALMEVDDRRGLGAIEAGEALLAHLDRLDGIRESWRPVPRARSAAGAGGDR